MFSLFQYKKKGKTPVIRQHEYTECGLACLAMVLGHYEHHVSVSQLRRELTVSADAGTSMAELMTLASDKNMTGRVLKGEITEIESAELPLIAFWRGNHFVVIVKVDGRSVTVHDPASGVRRAPCPTRPWPRVACKCYPAARTARPRFAARSCRTPFQPARQSHR